MATGAGRLDVTLGLNAAEFTAGLTKAERDAEKFQANLVRLGGQIGTALGVGLGVAVGAFAALTKSSIDAADKLNDLSKATGVSVEQLGGIGFAAKQSGADLEGVAQSFGKLNLKIAEAARGEKEASEAFKVLGISVKDAAGQTKNADKIFAEIATAFEGFADGPEKAALGNALFGKSYQTLLPLLADGGRALQDNIEYYQRFGGTTTETARKADEFNDTLGKLTLVTGQLGRKLAEELLPPLQAVADELLKAAETSGAFDFLAKSAKVAFETIAVLFVNIKFVFEAVGREIAAIAAQLVALAKLDLAGFRAISDAVKDDGKRARAELDALEQRILGLAAGPSLASRIGTVNPDRELERLTRPRATAPRLSGPSIGGAKVKKEIDEHARHLEGLARAYQNYVEGLASGIEKEEKLTEVQKVSRAIEQGRFGNLIPQQRELILGLAQAADEQEHYNQIIKENAAMEERIAKAQDERLKRIDDLTGRSVARRDLADLKLLDEALRDSIITLEEYKIAQDKIAGFDKELEKTNDAAEELGLTFSSALEDAIVDFSSLRDVIKGLEQDLLRIGTRKLVTEPLANWATEFFKGLGGSGGGGFGSILGSIFGGGQSLAGVFASGTDFVPRDGLAYLHRGERVVTAEDNRKGGGGMVNNLTFVLPPGGVSRETQNQIALRASQAIRQAQGRNA